MNIMKWKGVKLELDKVRFVKFNFNAFVALERQYGTIEEAFAAFETGSFEAILHLLHAGLIHEDKSLTADEVGDLFDPNDLESITTALTEAIAFSMPAEPAEDTEAQLPEGGK